MSEYHKIQTVYLRDPATKHRTLLEGEWALPEFAYLADLDWVWTEKIDGTNIRVLYTPGGFEYRGRTDDAQIPATLVARLVELFPVDALAKAFDGPAVLYGEGYGAKIQKGGGHYIPDGCGFILFDVQVGGVWLRREDVSDVAAKLGVPVVPEIGHGSLLAAVGLARLGFPSVIAEGRCAAEGLVMRPRVELCDRMGRRLIAKIKAKDFAR